MKMPIFIALAVFASTTATLANPPSDVGNTNPAEKAATTPAATPTGATGDESLTRNPADKQKTDAGTGGAGTTANPTAKPADSSVAEKQMKDGPASTSGTNTASNPNASPTDSSVQEKQKQDSGATK